MRACCDYRQIAWPERRGSSRYTRVHLFPEGTLVSLCGRPVPWFERRGGMVEDPQRAYPEYEICQQCLRTARAASAR